MPRGALLYLEAADFSVLLQEWNDSPVKRAWLASDSYEAFSRSRLFIRLHQAQDEYSSAAGIPPDMKFAAQAAGKQSALAIYDIGKLEFLYISRVTAADVTQSPLWQGRAKFEPRAAAGATFYVRTDPESHRTAAFALSGDLLLLATKEDLLAAALTAISGGAGPRLSEESWFAQAVAAGGAAGDLRMVLNLEKLTAAPHFRSYWVQRNVADLRAYASAVCDLHRTATTYREERVLLPRGEASSTSAGGKSAGAHAPEITPQGMRDVAALVAAVPAGAGVYRALANPSPEAAVNMLWAKLLDSRLSAAPASTIAPSVVLTGGGVGGAGDLETRIDEPPPVPAQVPDALAALRQLAGAAGPTAMLTVQSAQENPGTHFVEVRTAVALAAANPWEPGAVRAALQSALRELTTQDLGLGWRRQGKGASEYDELDGRFPLFVAVRGPAGRSLWVANDAAMLQSLLFVAESARPGEPARYAAGFSHGVEQPGFFALTRVLDCAKPLAAYGAPPDGATHEPAFFSENLGSLSRVLSAVKSQTVSERETGGKLVQTVVYKWE
jgi:hypothetical protein